MNSPSALSVFQRFPGRRPLVLAHRGARRRAPENTLVAFERALADGADGIEFDVRMSADGELFVSHDDEILLCDGSRVAVHRLSGSQIRALRTHSLEPVPTLREVLAFSARTGALLNVELKGDVPAPLFLADRATAQIRAFGAPQILLSSFHLGQVQRLARGLPELPVALLVHEDQHLLGRVLPLGPLGAQGVHPQAEQLGRKKFDRMRRKAALVNVWTVNTRDEALRFRDWGADAIITDVPDQMVVWLNGGASDGRSTSSFSSTNG